MHTDSPVESSHSPQRDGGAWALEPGTHDRGMACKCPVTASYRGNRGGIMQHGDDIAWAQNEALRLSDRLGGWEAVAEALAPYLLRSRAAWWSVGEGKKITEDKIEALRAYLGLPSRRRIRRRATIQVQRETRELLRAVCLPGESFDAAIVRLCRMVGTMTGEGE
jgi:hypothetical protein